MTREGTVFSLILGSYKELARLPLGFGRGPCGPPVEPRTRSNPVPSRVLACVILSVAALAGCGGKEETEKKAFAVEKEKKNGPVTAVMRLSHDELTIADRLRVELETVSAPEWDIEFPVLGDELEAFAVSDYGASGPEAIEGNLMRRVKWYVLEPFLSGEYEIPELEIAFFQAGEDKKHSLLTDPVKVKVVSLMGEDRDKLKDIHPIKDVVSLPPPSRAWIAITGVVLMALACLLAAGAKMLKRRGGTTALAVAPPPAHETAYRRLKELVDRDLIAQGKIDEFYVELSDIIRRYIEDRFGLHAPDMTTEEFLAEVSSGETLKRKDAGLLDEFLAHCDLVKFAKHRPTDEEIRKAFDSAKAFIGGTKES